MPAMNAFKVVAGTREELGTGRAVTVFDSCIENA